MHRLFDLRQRGLLTVIAHPERYRCLWRSPELLERLVNSGAAALLDTAALVGKYGREPKHCALELLERGLYHAACSDAHRDDRDVEKGMRFIAERYGEDEIEPCSTVDPRRFLPAQGHRRRGADASLGARSRFLAEARGVARHHGGFRDLLQLGALKLKPSNEALLRVDGWSLALYFVLFTTMHLIRAARWSLLLAPVQRVPLGTVVRVALVGYMAIALLPFRMGEAARPLLIRRDAKVNAWAATGTVGAERLIDGLTVSVFLLAALRIARPMENLPDRIGDLPVPVSIIPNLAFGTASMFAAGCVAMGLFYLRPAWAERLTLAMVGPVSKRFARWLATRLADTASGLGFLTALRTLPFLFATLAYWLLNASSWWVLAQGCGSGQSATSTPSPSCAWSRSASWYPPRPDSTERSSSRFTRRLPCICPRNRSANRGRCMRSTATCCPSV